MNIRGIGFLATTAATLFSMFGYLAGRERRKKAQPVRHVWCDNINELTVRPAFDTAELTVK